MALLHVERLLERLRGVIRRGAGWRALCPAHDDHNPSLDVDLGGDDRILLICRSHRCSSKSIVDAIGLQERDLFAGNHYRRNDRTAPPRRSQRQNGEAKPLYDSPEAFADTLRYLKRRFDYQDADNQLVYVTFRIEPPGQRKQFLPCHRRGDGKWIGKHMPTPRVLYRLPQLLATRPDDPVLVLEGEGCVEAAVGLGWTATTSAAGSKAATKTDWSPLKGRAVVVLPDADEDGATYAADVVHLAREAGAASVRVLALPGLKADSGDDLVDWVSAKELEDLDRDEIGEALAQLIENTMNDSSTSASEQDEAIDSNSVQKPTVLIPGQHGETRIGTHAFVRAVLAALPKDTLYRRGAVVGELLGPRGAVQFVDLTDHRARAVIDAHIQLELKKWNPERKALEVRFVPCSRDLAGVFLASAAKGKHLRELRAIVHYPVFTRRDFALVQPGWNEADGLLYDQPTDLEGVPES